MSGALVVIPPESSICQPAPTNDLLGDSWGRDEVTAAQEAHVEGKPGLCQFGQHCLLTSKHGHRHVREVTDA